MRKCKQLITPRQIYIKPAAKPELGLGLGSRAAGLGESKKKQIHRPLTRRLAVDLQIHQPLPFTIRLWKSLQFFFLKAREW